MPPTHVSIRAVKLTATISILMLWTWSTCHAVTVSEILKVIKAGGKLSQAQLLRCRVRYISDGMVLVSKSFVDGYLAEHRDKWGKRKQGGHKIKGGDWGHFYSFRYLQVDVIRP